MIAPALSLGGFAALETCAVAGLSLHVIHATLALPMRPKGQRLAPMAIIACALVGLSLAADMLAALDWQASPNLAAALDVRGMLPVLWSSLPLAVAMAIAARRIGDRLWWVLAVLPLTAVPPVATALGAWWNLAAAGGLCAGLVLVSAQLRRDVRIRHASPTSASVAEAMNVISVGMLVTDGHGGSSFMNDAMRSELEGFGFPTDLGDLSQVWEGMRLHAVTLAELGIDAGGPLPSGFGAAPDRVLARTPDGRVVLGLLDPPRGDRRGTRAFSLDVTQLTDAAQRLSAANSALEQANDELSEQLEDVRAVARQTAFLHMRANVHDVIGQRLSILQRFLDAGKVDEESVAQLRDLMESIVRDMRQASKANPAESLDDVVEAFTLVNVDIVVQGELPADRAASSALAKVVREASTNACRHAQARTVWVDLGMEAHDGREWATLEIHDDGIPSAPRACAEGGAVREGTGIEGMRRAVGELGGSLSVRTGPPFAVSARIPLGHPLKRHMPYESLPYEDHGIGGTGEGACHA